MLNKEIIWHLTECKGKKWARSEEEKGERLQQDTNKGM